MLKQFSSNSTHLALLYIGLYSLSTDMLSTCLLSDVLKVEDCLAALDVGAMVCIDTGRWVDTIGEDRLCQDIVKLTLMSGLPLIPGRGR